MKPVQARTLSMRTRLSRLSTRAALCNMNATMTSLTYGSNQYPSIGWMNYAVQGTDKDIKYPFHVSEYAHSMGNAVGNLVDYWKAMESTNYFMGGAIWDWVDQAMYNYTPDGTRYWAYGGDFGDKPMMACSA